MNEIAVTIAGNRYKAKNLDESFVKFVEEDLKSAGVMLDRDNSAEQLFGAYLRLANKWYHYEQEIDEILSSIEIE
jgi:hypothetical protein